MGALAGIAGGVAGGLMSASGPKSVGTNDVSGNIKNANKTFDTATSFGNQTMDAAKGLNSNALSHLSEVAGQQLPMLQNVNNQANSNYANYQNTFQPLQQQQAQQAKDYTSGENIDMLRGRAVADSNASQQAARQNSAMALAAEGVDPASIHGGALDRMASIKGAAQNAGVANQSYLDTQNTGRQLVQGANALGMQVQQQGNEQAQIGSGIGSSLVNAETGSNAGAINNLQGADTYLNTGVNANKSSADIASEDNKDRLKAAQFAAEAAKQKGAGIGGALSSLAPLAGMALMEKGGPVSQRGALPYAPVPGTTDTVPMLATPGEFMIPKDVVDHKGAEFFHKLIDSTRLKANERRAIPQPVFAHQSNH